MKEFFKALEMLKTDCQESFNLAQLLLNEVYNIPNHLINYWILFVQDPKANGGAEPVLFADGVVLRMYTHYIDPLEYFDNEVMYNMEEILESLQIKNDKRDIGQPF